MTGRSSRHKRAADSVSANRVDVQVLHPHGRAVGRTLGAAGKRFLRRLGLKGSELSISVVEDRAIRHLNRRWRRKDAATDVLSFPAEDATAVPTLPRVLGDVVISLDTARRRARALGTSTQAELDRYLAHGLLHLLGYDHQTRAEAAEMAALEEKLLGDRGLI